ncbi:MAG: ATP-dependent DNA helicase RecG [Flavobacteriales bacterium CG_4_8_14_3_um_filter_35_10]|nr:ATP-dependent DNA helicase RecG [Zetaproteobacteria bacterium]PIX06955.1 MAG: ATP-dependent DNA helicase RecG [Flavobacteriales bacterium CG_4_8_14_3_um_filter_35_10]
MINTPIAYLKGVGPLKANLLQSELHINTFADLLEFYPFRYIDRSQFYKINQLQQNTAEVQIIGKITSISTIEQQKGNRLVAQFTDGTHVMDLVWFKGVKWIKSNLKTNIPYVAFGKLNWFNGIPNMPHPDLELLSEFEKGIQTKMQAIYPSSEKLLAKGLNNRTFIKLIKQMFSEHILIKESLSAKLIFELNLMPRKEAVFNIHFPTSQAHLSKAQYRLKFEEFFFIQLQLLRQKMNRKKKLKGYIFDKVGANFNTFFNHHLPFELTNAQKNVVKEIRKDMVTGAQMNRLLQGDVGSGKTIVAVLCILIAIDNGFQAAFLAPTEILAKQHFSAATKLLTALPINIALLTGATKPKERRQQFADLASGKLNILIGTHAVLEDKVVFNNLGLAIIDEQHRFGVAQRSKMWLKNKLPPHILVMTATPIPRTLAMSVYGDLDISVIDELPPGRKEIVTGHRFDSNRLKVFKFLSEEIAKGHQVYIVYPLIQESEQMDYKDLMDGYESISRYFQMPEYQISIMHGKMKPEAKDYEMQRFVKGETQIMVATTVIEVGVDVPNASVMLIESAERFGLSQLHQLRGRVGRGNTQSFCILMSGNKLSDEAKVRLDTMVNSNDGFEIAEVDLKLRGPGNLMGTQQSGVLNLKIADLVKDAELLKLARQSALEILKTDPDLLNPENKFINAAYADKIKYNNLWANIS